MLRLHSRARRLAVREELRLRQWQLILGLTRLAAQARRWARIFNQHRSLMALAFLIGVLLGLLPLMR